METKKFSSPDEYIAGLPRETKGLVKELRKTIKDTAPGAEEVISYNMPAFKWHGMLVWYAAYQHHIGLYPTGSPIKAFKNELTGYKTSKGAIQFPIEKGIPVALVKKIVRFKMKENQEKAAAKEKKKK